MATLRSYCGQNADRFLVFLDPGLVYQFLDCSVGGGGGHHKCAHTALKALGLRRRGSLSWFCVWMGHMAYLRNANCQDLMVVAGSRR